MCDTLHVGGVCDANYAFNLFSSSASGDASHSMRFDNPRRGRNNEFTPFSGHSDRNFPLRRSVQIASLALSDDAPLIAATLAGDNAAFGRLVGLYQDRLYNSLLRVVGDDADDIVQDALVQAYTKLNTFRGNSAFYTWLYRIAFNLAMSHARRGKKTTSLDGMKAGWGSEPTDGQPTPDAGLERREDVELVQNCLAKLNTEYRTILVLREIDGCRYEEIAEILDLPIGTVRSRLFRARLALRDQLAPRLHVEKIADTR
jgi:RNA polymerase sigma-70 factor (ECF subfamily)